VNLTDRGEDFGTFWTERRLATLTTLRADGTPHVVPVGVTVDLAEGVARVICSGPSVKARNVAAGRGSIAVCQVEGRLWSTLEGSAVVLTGPEDVADAERRYAERYRQPRVNPQRVVIRIDVTRVLGPL
jgi:F420H(2)-dependent biliverdin reductase